MRKISVIEFISLDGVVQAPGGPEEDRSGDFALGGWTVAYFEDVLGESMGQQMTQQNAELLLRRKTFELVESKVSPRGVIIANYERTGEVQTGSF